MTIQASIRTCRRAAVISVGATLSILPAAGCTVDVPADEPAAASTSEPLLGIGIGINLPGVCLPLTCCFPSGGGWVAGDPFEDQLQALGCTEPHAYAQSFGRSYWWLYSQCPANEQVTSAVIQYALVPPYFANFVVNACLELPAITGGHANTTFVEWDPTCSSCSFTGYFSPQPAIVYETPEGFQASPPPSDTTGS